MPDIEYFAFLTDATRVHNPAQPDDKKDNEGSCPIDELHNRLQYAINCGGYQLDYQNLDPEHMEAVQRRYSEEQDERNQDFQRMFMKMLGKAKDKTPDKTTKESVARIDDATWHISYHNDRDKQWAKALLEELGCKKFKLYPTIDECLTPFKVSHKGEAKNG